MVSNDIAVNYHPRQGLLQLSCGNEAFARLRDVIIAEAWAAEVIETQPGAVKRIMIEEVSSGRPSTRFPDGVALLCCALFVLAFMFVLAIGVATIASWVR
jgi:hypothetical protein